MGITQTAETKSKLFMRMSSGTRKKTLMLTLMVLPGAIYLLILRYLPMAGIILAFKSYKVAKGGFISSVLASPWVGLENFKFIFTSNDAWIMVRNTLGYNIAWLFLGLLFAVTFAIMLNELHSKMLAKTYQTLMFFPHFMSWVVVGYFVFAFISTNGVIPTLLINLGIWDKATQVDIYINPAPWPSILTISNLWKGTGYASVLYLAAICAIDKSLYEAAVIDGASKWQQTRFITLPHLKTMIVILSILRIGSIFSADFGLFYNVPRNSGALFSVTQVVDTFVYRALMNSGRIDMPTAVGLFQSMVGFVLILITNYIVNRIEPESALF